ncbi:diguanylate cyclase [Metarhizobium album]|uniref:Diguanylate cyclase n=2 Tax=Metarhizobium album TaxID=2182425 RepID=A0A2U2DTQ4_9HYPH|nr:diguanylate cyclase [Rhizobium album]
MTKDAEQTLLSLFEAFALKCMQLQQAVRFGDDNLVRVLDRELGPLIESVLAYRAEGIVGIYMQLQFLSNLIREDADDRSSVMRHSAALSVLLDRYLGGNAAAKYAAMLNKLSWKRATDTAHPENDSFLNEVILDALPDRIAVVTTDYRFLYFNPAGAAYLKKHPIELVGRHVVDFVGPDCFERRLRGSLDQCFAGAKMEFQMACRIVEERETTMRFRLAPLRTRSDAAFGAVLVWSDAVQPASAPV